MLFSSVPNADSCTEAKNASAHRDRLRGLEIDRKMRTGKAPRKVELRQFIRNFADGAAFPVLKLHRTQAVANPLVEVREDTWGLGEP